MFGYVRIYKDELKVREYEAYRGIYCSVCRSLGKNYGVFSRMLLSYDVTFLGIVKLASSNTVPNFKGGRCPFHPSKRCNYCTNAESQLDFVCAAAIIMFYYKIKDNIADSSFLKKLLMFLILPYAAMKRKKAAKLYPEIEEIVASSMEAQAETEKEDTSSFDKAAHASADALGKIFALGEEDKTRELYKMGYFVGRWVYLTDAADDIKSDLKHGSFNVFVNHFSLTDVCITDEQKEKIRSTLNMSCACAIEAFENTQFTVMLPIVENILFDGMEAVIQNILERKK